MKSLLDELQFWKSRNLRLDMTRGKPSPEQLNLSMPMFNITECIAEDGTDCRNYGGLKGIPEARRLFGEYFGTDTKNVLVGGNSSLELMYKIVQDQTLKNGNFHKDHSPIFLCPSPGYDRHFSICEALGIEMVPITIGPDGPDMGEVLEKVKNPRVSGMWCVPKYSNPTGDTYSMETVRQLATMEPKNMNFRLYWDNAYAVHDLEDESVELASIIDECAEAGNPDRPYVFGSTSKITFAGSGVAAIASSEYNIDQFEQSLSVQTIGSDKLNQLRHVRFLKDLQGIREHMARHRAILRPKFDVVDEILLRRFGTREGEFASWSKPKGGYFISLNVAKGMAKKVIRLAQEAGVKLTPAGSTYPYQDDPDNRNIRIAPSFPSFGKVEDATQILAVCIEVIRKNEGW